MRRKITILIIQLLILSLTLAVAGMFFVPAFLWNRMEAEPLKVWIVDKTIPEPDYREHKGLVWILNHNKIINESTNDYFAYDKDYYGFFPIDKYNYEVKNMPSTKENPDLIYLTDTYGVYDDDYLTSKVEESPSELIYGGLKDEELNILRENIGHGNTLIGEFNIASAPTNEKNRKELSELFGVRWKGWRGCYFKDLSKGVEVPDFLVSNYEKQHNTKWTFNGTGIVLISDKEEIRILEGEKHIGKNELKIAFNEDYKKEFNVSKEIPYEYWFEFIESKPGRETLANYNLSLTEEGKKLMEDLGLPSVFPAITRDENPQYRAYYFAGDFADAEKSNELWKYYGFDKIKKITSSFSKNTGEYFYWNCYVPVMNKVIADMKEMKKGPDSTKDQKDNILITAKTEGNGFSVLKNNKWEKFFVKGVNIGAALPGKWFTEFPQEEEVYLDWFKKIGEMKANSIRVYTLLPPAFYNALEHYNRTNPESPLWLLQEIWPEENPEDHNYLKESYVKDYYKEIEYIVDAIHGKANIKERKGRAYGVYTSDVSPYVLGYLVGRELEPEEVISTNEKNKDFSYQGEYLSSSKIASASEAWLAMNCDYVVKYENQNYRWQHPVAIVSWPTLDPISHDSEWNTLGLKELEYNDKVSIDINHIEITSKMQAGFFGAYHIYPNYPDFMNNESKYNNYADEEGRLRYGGYLKEFIENHKKYPALVAEFGLPTGMGNAHTSPDGYNHGGLSEEQQGEGIVRMIKAIQRENYAGGLIFQWMDEWAKKTWITEPFMIPYDRHVLWRNAVDPEQNYGILAMESEPPKDSSFYEEGKGEIQRVELKQDTAYLYMDITLKNNLDFSSKRLFVGLDTYDRNKGEFKFNPEIQAASKTGIEFLIDLQGENKSKLLVHPGYNISKEKYSSYGISKGIFEEISPKINSERVTKDGKKIPSIYEEGSKLNYGNFSDNSNSHWYVEGNKIYLRIPWGKINFTDPSESRVLDDERNLLNPKRDELKTTITEGILFSVLMVDEKTKDPIDTLSSEAAFSWKPWTEVQYTERLKKSYYIIKEYFKNIK